MAQDLSSLSADQITSRTVAAYDRLADCYCDETRDRVREADYALFFRHLAHMPPHGLHALARGPFDLLDLGCGPGHDLAEFRRRGHRAMGLDGNERFVAMAHAHSDAVVLKQNLASLDLPQGAFDGIFASASLFHIPPLTLPDVLRPLHRALRAGGVLFTLNPKGADQTGWIGDRYACYLRLSTWRRILRSTGFRLVEYAHRPDGLPQRRRQWIAAVWIREEREPQGHHQVRGR